MTGVAAKTKIVLPRRARNYVEHSREAGRAMALRSSVRQSKNKRRFAARVTVKVKLTKLPKIAQKYKNFGQNLLKYQLLDHYLMV